MAGRLGKENVRTKNREGKDDRAKNSRTKDAR